MDAIRRFIGHVFPRGAILLATLTFAGYAMGLVRDRAFARTYGASTDLDAYNAALQLPEIVLNILVAAGLGAAFVPIFARLRSDEAEAADRFSRTVLTVGAVVMGIGAVVLFVIAPETARFVVPTWTGEQLDLYVELFRVMCVTTVIFAISFTIGEMLLARRRFLSYGIAPLLYNTGIVLGAVLLGPSMGIMGVALGTVAGALLHLGARLLGIVRTDASLRPLWHVRTPSYKQYLRLSIPRMFSEPIESLTFLWFTAAASGIVAGGVSAVSYARNFQSVPVSIVGIAFATAVFPVLSDAAARRDRSRFARVVGTNTLTIGALTVTGAVLMAILSSRLIGTLLGGGEFDDADVALTASVLAAFTLSIPLEALSALFVRAIHATRNTLLPVIASIVGLALTLGGVEVLKGSQGLLALPLAFALGQGIKLAILAVVLVIRVRHLGGPDGPPDPLAEEPHADPDAPTSQVPIVTA
jgi:putative peptidoglycan lipid II flippase